MRTHSDKDVGVLGLQVKQETGDKTMSVYTSKTTKAAMFGIAAIGATAFIASVAMPDMAFAAGKGAEKSAGKKGGKSDAAKGKKDRPAQSQGKGNAFANLMGVHPSELGALNAANANENALLNASPNSRVGMIATYRDAVVAGQEMEAELEEAMLAIADMEEPTRSSGDIEADLLAAMEDEFATEEELMALEDELAAAVIYEDAQATITELEDALLEQPALETSLLELAANKPVTEAIEDAVKAMLGLE
jgi:hypothetical protein